MSTYENLALPQEIHRLSELAYNMWFSWNEDAIALFQAIDPGKWETVYHNPVRLLQETGNDAFERLAHDENFLERYRNVTHQWEQYKEQSGWFANAHPDHRDHKIAYFSAEFGFHESLPIYSGGLGVLAGDHCKSASDLGLPFVGVGLLYKKGYFNQKIDANGGQIAEQATYDFHKLAIRPALLHNQELTVDVALPGRWVRLKVWQVAVGNVTVYLLDADIDHNSPDDRGLTAQLYGGNQDTRIQQEMLLGIGGVSALRALQIYPYVYHINEGHAAFLSLERIREHVQHNGLPFATALEMIRASTLFTTHTPVPAGHDAFNLGMFEHYMQALLNALPNDRQNIINLGLDRDKNVFNMTYLAMNTATLRNGVSKLHGQVSREMFLGFHSGLNVEEVPIQYVTNGVHASTWLAKELKELYDRFLPGTWRTHQSNKDQWKPLDIAPNESLWKTHLALKQKLIEFVRDNLAQQRSRNGESPERINEVQRYLDPKALTIGFARRFATYKRATLIFSDHDRLDRLVNHAERPVQFLFAGKAHPADHPGQELIREIYRVSQLDRFRGKIIMLENYDMNMARYLVQGVDVWLNNPRRPYEASGTSGEKAALNGVINFSILDGWWEEGYDGENGWAIEATRGADLQTQERENTESLYSVFEQAIVPLYYNQNEEGIPQGWVNRMKHSIMTLAPVYNTDRMVQEYTNRFYTLTMKRALSFSSDNYELAGRMARFKQFIKDNWKHVTIIGLVDPDTGVTVQESLAGSLTKKVVATVALGPIWHRDVAVEIVYYREKDGEWEPVVVPLEFVSEAAPQTFTYSAEIPAHLQHKAHYTIRARPVSPDFAHSFELTYMTRF